MTTPDPAAAVLDLLDEERAALLACVEQVPAEALRALEESRRTLRSAFLAADPVALDVVTHAHQILGVLTLRGWTCFVAHHEARHARQVAEIAEALAGASVAPRPEDP